MLNSLQIVGKSIFNLSTLKAAHVLSLVLKSNTELKLQGHRESLWRVTE